MHDVIPQLFVVLVFAMYFALLLAIAWRALLPYLRTRFSNPSRNAAAEPDDARIVSAPPALARSMAGHAKRQNARIKSGTILVFVILSGSAAQGQKVETRYDHSLDFAAYKTYAWKEGKLATQQGRENEKLIGQALVSAVNAELRAKGLVEDSRKPDLYVSYSGGSALREAKAGAAYAPRDLAGWGVGEIWTSNAIPGSVPNVWTSMQGVLLFELTDRRTGSLAWSAVLRKKINKTGKMPEDIDKAAAAIVKKAFRNFPPNPRTN